MGHWEQVGEDNRRLREHPARVRRQRWLQWAFVVCSFALLIAAIIWH
jgi:hypothetical protein